MQVLLNHQPARGNCVNYLVNTTNDNLRKSLKRLSSHQLEIEQGSFSGIVRENGVCKLCRQNVVEAELHCSMCCNTNTILRENIYICQVLPGHL